MAEVALDASAVLAYIYDEPGASTVQPLLGRAVISSVNYSEVVAKLADLGARGDEVQRLLGRLNLQVIPFNEDQALVAGLMRPSTREAGLSLGDRACLALSQSYGLTALTSDRKWSDVTIDVDIRPIR